MLDTYISKMLNKCSLTTRNIVETFKCNIFAGLPDLCCYAACQQCSSTYKYDKMNAIKLKSERNHHATMIYIHCYALYISKFHSVSLMFQHNNIHCITMRTTDSVCFTLMVCIKQLTLHTPRFLSLCCVFLCLNETLSNSNGYNVLVQQNEDI